MPKTYKKKIAWLSTTPINSLHVPSTKNILNSQAHESPQSQKKKKKQNNKKQLKGEIQKPIRV